MILEIKREIAERHLQADSQTWSFSAQEKALHRKGAHSSEIS